MNVILINQYFYPDISATGQLLTDLAEDLTAKGIKITVLTSQNFYLGGKKYPLYEIYKGIKIYRAKSPSLGKSNLIFRIADFLFFYLFLFINLMKISDADIVLCLSRPPFVSIMGLVISRMKRAKFIYKVEDLYPDLPEEFEVIKPNGLVSKIGTWLTRFSLAKSDCIITLGQFMKKRLLGKGIDKQIHVIDSWADQSEIYPFAKEDTRFYKEWNLEGKFVVHYSGNMGMGHTFDMILEAASRLSVFNDIIFLFVGNGSRRSEIEEYVSKNRLNNIQIKDYVPREYLNNNLNCADVSLITLREKMVGIMVPSKLYGIMASGKPIIFVGPEECEIAHIIKQQQIGYVIENGDTDGFVEAIVNLKNDSEFKSKLGNKSRLAFTKYYERKIATEKYYKLLIDLIER